MEDIKLYGRCDACNKKSFFVRKREIKLPIGSIAKSKKLLCTPCYNAIKLVIK